MPWHDVRQKLKLWDLRKYACKHSKQPTQFDLLISHRAPGRNEFLDALCNFPIGDTILELLVLGLDVVHQVELSQEVGDVPLLLGTVAHPRVRAESWKIM